jgi:hypothetical protein
MSEPHVSEAKPPSANREDMMSALFANLVVQQSSLAMMLLGKTPHPESGQVAKDIDSARMFIDQLEMLEVKTKGNLRKEEAALLKQSLMSLRLAFVAAVESGPDQVETPAQSGARQAPSAQAPEPAEASGAQKSPAAEEDEHRKKFTKKY